MPYKDPTKKREWLLKNKNRRNNQSKSYYEKHKDEINLKRREKYKENIDGRREKSKNYVKENEERIKVVSKIYRLKNSDYLKLKSKEWRDNNKERNAERMSKYSKTHRKEINDNKKRLRESNIINKLIDILRNRTATAFRRKHYNKNSKTFELLGVEFEVVKKHIESQFTFGMCWEFVGPLIQIDHIIPLSSAKNKEELVKLCHYTNLQPLWMIDNLEKGSKILI